MHTDQDSEDGKREECLIVPMRDEARARAMIRDGATLPTSTISVARAHQHGQTRILWIPLVEERKLTQGVRRALGCLDHARMATAGAEPDRSRVVFHRFTSNLENSSSRFKGSPD